MSDVTASLPLMLKHLRLGSIKDHWQPLADKAVTEHWRPEQYLSELCALELASREDKRLQRYLKDAALPPGKPVSYTHLTLPTIIGISGSTSMRP